MANKSQDNDSDAPAVSDAERIARLEKRVKLQTLLVIALFVFCVILLGGLGTLFLSGGDSRPDENRAQLEAHEQRFTELNSALKKAESFNLQAQVLEAKIERILGQGQLNNFSTVRKLALEQEASHQQFLKALKQGMLDLSRMVRGSRTWYDFYAEQIDELLAGSDRRERELKALKGDK